MVLSRPVVLTGLAALVGGALMTLPIFTTPAAAAGCGKPRNAFDNVYCLGNAFAAADKDLNDVYAKLQKSLPADRMAAVKKEQLAWIKIRDSKCSESRGDSDLIDLDCAVTMTESRVAELRKLANGL